MDIPVIASDALHVPLELIHFLRDAIPSRLARRDRRLRLPRARDPRRRRRAHLRRRGANLSLKLRLHRALHLVQETLRDGASLRLGLRALQRQRQHGDVPDRGGEREGEHVLGEVIEKPGEEHGEEKRRPSRAHRRVHGILDLLLEQPRGARVVEPGRDGGRGREIGGGAGDERRRGGLRGRGARERISQRRRILILLRRIVRIIRPVTRGGPVVARGLFRGGLRLRLGGPRLGLGGGRLLRLHLRADRGDGGVFFRGDAFLSLEEVQVRGRRIEPARAHGVGVRAELVIVVARQPPGVLLDGGAELSLGVAEHLFFIPLADGAVGAVAQDVRGEQVRAVRQAKGGVEQVVAPAHRAHHRRSHRLHLRAKVRLHRLAVLVHSRVRALRLLKLLHSLGSLLRQDLLRGAEEHGPHLERRAQLQAKTLAGVFALLVPGAQEAQDVILELRKVGFAAALLLRGERSFGGDREHRRVRHAEQPLGVVRDEPFHLVDLALVLQPVALVDHERHLLAPLADVAQKLNLRLGHRPIGAQDEEHEVRPRHELLGEPLLTLEDHVRARGVHDVHLAEQIGGDELRVEPVFALLGSGLVSKLQHGDLVRGGQDSLLERLLTEHRVDHRRLARVELADDDEQEELLQTFPGFDQKPNLLQRGRRLREERHGVVEEDALALQQGLRGRIDNLTGHGGRPGGPDRG
mmetsp:Transcript_2112/g.8916  ORF Transcript_2112/g.8916 Transcript_2112/m.8916 type:complete len:693 (-) Transcript_2112:1005-3083(-)